MRLHWAVLNTCLSFFVLSEARPGRRAPSPLPANDSSFSSFRSSSTEAIPSASVLANSTKVSATSIRPSVTQTSGTTHAGVIGSDISSIGTGPLSTSAANSSSSSLPSSTHSGTSPQVTPASTNAGVWTYRNSIFGPTFIGTGIPPAVINHNEQLYVLYTETSSNVLLLAVGNNDNFGNDIFPVYDQNGRTFTVSNTQAPALASFDGILHTVFQQGSSLVHVTYNDSAASWATQDVFNQSYTNPTLAVYNGELFLAMLAGNEIFFSSWNIQNGWNSVVSVAGGVTSWGSPALYVQEATTNYSLMMLYPQDNSGRKIQTLIYNAASGTWSPSSPTPPESTAYGVSASYGDGITFMGFQENANSGDVYVSVFGGGSWANHEDTGQSSHDTPSLAVLDNVVNVIFNSNNANRDILWAQRPLTSYSLESWMSVIDDDTYLSALSIPGTHDSAAVSALGWVACQTTTITEQLTAGIRYFDLRSGIMDNVLYMYHGQYYLLDPPNGITLASQIQQIQKYLAAHPTETVIVSIKQDHPPVDSTTSFATAVSQLINQNPSLWSTTSSLPISLGDVRGKIQLMRRYSVNQIVGEKPIGVDLTNWSDNNGNFQIFSPSGPYFTIQDQYSFDEGLADIVNDKWNLVLNLLEEAVGDEDTTTWYINFASATHELDADLESLITPGFIARGVSLDTILGTVTFQNGVNWELRWWIYQQPLGQRRGYGTILMDYPESPEDDLIARIIASNM